MHEKSLFGKSCFVSLSFHHHRQVLVIYVDHWPQFPVLLLDHVRIFEVVYQLCCPLNPRVAKLANLFRVKLQPFFHVKVMVKLPYELCVYEIDESVPHITLILQINRQVPCSQWVSRKNHIFS